MPAQPPFVPMPAWRASLYAAGSLLLGITQGLGLNLVAANITGIQGSLGATQIETTWLLAAYFATNMTGTILMFKMRSQFGLRRFAEIGILVYIAVVFAHLLTNDLRSAVIVRAFMGIAVAPLSTLGFFYMLEWLPPAKKMSIGVSFGLLGTSLSASLARVISPDLLAIGQWHGLYLLEAGLSLMCLTVIFILPLTHPPRVKVFDRDDWISFPLLAAGFGALGIMLSLGRAYWWFDTPWLGVLGAVAIGAMVMFVIVELHRKNPMIDLRWLASGDMLLFAGSLILFRILLSEQSVGAFGLFTVLGLQNDQLIPLFWVIGATTLASTFWLVRVLRPERTSQLHLLALVAIAVAAWMDSTSTVLSRPEQFYVSQSLMGFAAAVFLPPALVSGFMRALAKGPQYILSFLLVFLTTQTFGGLLGSALFSSFISIREKFHSNMLSESISLLNPLVAQRIQTYGGAYARTLTDPALRNAEGVALLSQSVTQQANILAYNDMFLLIFFATLATMAALISHMLLTRRAKRRALAAPVPA